LKLEMADQSRSIDFCLNEHEFSKGIGT
jgi:hypothetical protein